MTKAEFSFKNVRAYFTGNLRYRLYYSRFKFLIPAHIQEQIDFRIKFMRKECYESGQCVICGCQTTALQMANKACDAPCYPQMMSSEMWYRFFIFGRAFIDSKNKVWLYNKAEDNLTLIPWPPAQSVELYPRKDDEYSI